MTAIVQRPDLLTTQRHLDFDAARQDLLRIFAERVFAEPQHRIELLQEIGATLRAMDAIWRLNEEAGDG